MEKLLAALAFDDQGLIPAIIYDGLTKTPLTLCYLNREALAKTLETGEVHVFRRSKRRLMKKGDRSGHTQTVKAIHVDCEGRSLAIAVEQKVAACHHGYFTCYYRRYDPKTDSLEIAEERLFDPEAVYGEK